MGIRLWSAAVTCTVVGTGVLMPAPAAALPFTPAPTSRTHQPLPLERLFNNRAISDDARPQAADFDGAGHSLSAQDLASAGWSPGQRLRIDAARLRWPDRAPGEVDNVRADGQSVQLRGTGAALSFLVAASSPGRPGDGARGTGTIRYSDGSTSSYTLSAPDWRSGPLSTKAVALPHLNTDEGQRLERARIYPVSVPVRPGRAVTSVVLPPDPGPAADLHVFDVVVRDGTGWTGSWAASTGGYTTVGPWVDRTLRLVAHTSVGGPRARIRLENTFAAGPVTFSRASIAVPRAPGSAAAAQDPVPLTFDGEAGVRVPAGAQAFSDPVSFPVPEDGDLLISLHLPGTVTAAPVHSRAMQRSWVSDPGSGDRTAERGDGAYHEQITFWPFLTGVDVPGGPGSVVTLGDSITDGVRSTPDANRRWPDVLARRLLRQDQEGVPRYGVLNHGISANQVVADRYPGDGVSRDTGGVSAQHRLERDVLAQTGARTVVVFIGVNDVRWGASADAVIEGLRALAQRSRERGLRVVAATIAPCEGYPDCTADVDARRTAINTYLRERATARTGGPFDATLDFDAVLRDPERPQRMLPAYDSGDHLHPGDTGLQALAASVDLRTLVPPAS